jgi:hypothetical protein
MPKEMGKNLRGLRRKILTNRVEIIVLIVFLLVNLRVLTWFELGQPDYVMFSGDLRPPVNAEALMQHAFNSWNMIDFGLPSVYMPRLLDPYMLLITMFESAGANLYTSEILAVYLVYVLVSLLMYLYVKTLLNGNVVAGFVASLFLITNVGLVVDREVTAVGLIDTSLMILPTLLAFTLGMKKKSLKFMALSGFLFIFTYAFFPNYRTTALCLFSLLITFLYLGISKGVKASFNLPSIKRQIKPLAVFVVAVASISIWIVALIVANAGVFFSGYNQLAASPDLMKTVPSYDPIRLISMYSFYTNAYNGITSLNMSYVPYREGYIVNSSQANPLLIAVTFVPPLMAFGAILVSKRRRAPIYFAVVALLFLALVEGGASVVSSIPFMMAFRLPTNWIYLVIFTFSILVGLFASGLYQRIKQAKLRILSLVLIIALFSSAAYPLWTGDVATNFMDTATKGSYLPSYYSEINKNSWISNDYWTLLLPQKSTYLLYNFPGLGMLPCGNPYPLVISKPYISGLGTEYVQSQNLDLVNETYGIMEGNDNIAVNGTASASSWENFLPEKAIDGINDTRWVSDGDLPQSYNITWTWTQNLTSIKIYFQADAYAENFTIQTYNGENLTSEIPIINNNQTIYEYRFNETTHTTKLCLDFTNASGNQVGIWEIKTTTQNDIVIKENASAQSSEVGNDAENAIDGNLSTRWASVFNETSRLPQLFLINWDHTQQLTSIKIYFQAAYANDFTIQTYNGSVPTNEIKVINNNEIDPEYSFSVTPTTTLLINFTRADAYEQVSIEEIKTTTIENPTVKAQSAVYNEPKKSIDGRWDTRWASLQGEKPWYEIDWNQSYNLNRIKISFALNAYANKYTILTWNDKSGGWTSRIEESNNTSYECEYEFPEETTPTTRLLINFALGQISTKEIQVTARIDAAPVTMAVKGNAAASTAEKEDFAPAYAIDGNLDTRWTSKQGMGMPQSYNITWNETQNLTSIRIVFARNAIAENFNIQTWNDVNSNSGTRQIDIKNYNLTTYEYDFMQVTTIEQPILKIVQQPTPATKLCIIFTKAPKDQVSIREIQVTTLAPKGALSPSSSEKGHTAEEVFNGVIYAENYIGYWASDLMMPQWFQVDWNQTQQLNSIKIFFQEANQTDFTIQTRNGNMLTYENFVRNNTEYNLEYTFQPTTPTTTLLINFTRAAVFFQVGIFELLITTPAPKGEISVSSTEDPQSTETYAIDDDPYSYWISSTGMPQSQEISWNQTQSLNSIKINFKEDKNATKYTIQTWDGEKLTSNTIISNNNYTFPQMTPTTKLEITFTEAPLNQVGISEIQLTTRNDAALKFLGMVGIKYLLVEYNIIVGNLSDAEDLNVLNDIPDFNLTKKWDGASLYENVAYVQARFYPANNIFNFSDFSYMYQLIKDTSWSTLQYSTFINSTSNPDWTTLRALQIPEKFSWTELSPTSYKITAKANAPFLLAFLESFDLHWRATVNGETIPEKSHCKVNDFANGWLVNKTGDLTIIVEYETQSLLTTSIAASLSLCAAIVIILFRKNIMQNMRNILSKLRKKQP